jgi:DNA-nicking Smr family endonuclease
MLRKLRRGVLPVDVTLDLHGLRAGEAEESIFAFLTKARTAGERVARIIHGKGNHSPGNAGVLRGELGAWLSQGRSSRLVIAFATCPADAGATLVALAR